MAKRWARLAGVFLVGVSAVCLQCTGGGEAGSPAQGRCEVGTATASGGTKYIHATRDRSVEITSSEQGLSIRLTVAGRLYYDARATGGTVEVEFGDMFSIRHGTLSVRAEGGHSVADGLIDGRPIAPVRSDAPPSRLLWADGSVVDPGLDSVAEASARRFVLEAIEGQSTACPIGVALSPFSTPGQQENPEGSPGCAVCLNNCKTNGQLCVVGVLTGCTAFLSIPIIGPGLYAGCVAVGTGVCLGILNGCRSLCRTVGQPCCPVGCGFAGPPLHQACCNQGDSCLNSTFNINTCCAAGSTTCNGTECCSGSETCLPATNCCPTTQVCFGSKCCPPSSQCFLNTQNQPDCCPSGQVICQGACCAPGDACQKEVCVPCAPPNQVCNGQCCIFGQETCLSNQCCPNAQACGSVCCALNNPCLTDETTMAPVCCTPDRVACGPICCGLGRVCVSNGVCQ